MHEENGWVNDGRADGKLDMEAAKPGFGALSSEAAEARLRHTYARGRRTWFFWVVIILAANGGLLLGASPSPAPAASVFWLLGCTNARFRTSAS